MTGPRLRRLAAMLLLGAASTLTSPGAWAVPPRVLLVQPAAPDWATHAILLRLRAELHAAGFEVRDAAPDDLFDAAPPLDTAATPPQPSAAEPLRDPSPTPPHDTAPPRSPEASLPPFAALYVVPTPTGLSVDVHFIDGKLPAVRRVPAERSAATDSAVSLAIRAVELLRARRLSFATPHDPPPSAPHPPSSAPDALAPDTPSSTDDNVPPQPRATDPRPQPPPPSRVTPSSPPRPSPAAASPPLSTFRLEAAFGVLVSPGNFGVAATPVLRVARAASPYAFGLTWLSTLPTRISNPSGDVDITQQLVTLDVTRNFLIADAPLRPTLAAGIGAYRVGAEGHTRGPYPSRTVQAWTAAFQLGAGLRAPLGERISATLDADALLLLPEPVLRSPGGVRDRAGIPLLRATLGLAFTVDPGAAFP
ncbi:hypothetical protein [Chondromyces crocatus]|uniref:Outer membrane protein beta-barrel domain-containing protein n=1 Tax=Chondromyces crocatus TaxID=52 RepID=A0A0K1EHU3_CHOCO|nr:hypothetical protein [Chondromyces crocatus]AKT40252.1 uncharacterized protein CMC5_044050 [Chondromyces crocatus]